MALMSFVDIRKKYGHVTLAVSHDADEDPVSIVREKIDISPKAEVVLLGDAPQCVPADMEVIALSSILNKKDA